MKPIDKNLAENIYFLFIKMISFPWEVQVGGYHMTTLGPNWKIKIHFSQTIENRLNPKVTRKVNL